VAGKIPVRAGRGVIGVLVLLGALALTPAAAHAGSPPAGYGFDDHVHVVVGGGDDTSDFAQQNLAQLWDRSGVMYGCGHVTSTGPNQNSCQNDTTFAQNNYESDNVNEASPVGSIGGVNALNGNAAGANEEGTVNPINNPSRTDSVTLVNGSAVVTDNSITAADNGKSIASASPGIPRASYITSINTGAHTFHLSSAPNTDIDVNATAGATINATIATYDCVGSETGAMSDYARSSLTPTLLGSVAPCGDDLRADTFWGYAQDGVEVFGLNTHGVLLNGLSAPHLSAQDLFDVWNCSGGTGSAYGGTRNDTTGVVVTSGSASVSDTHITPSDQGHPVAGTGIPSNTFVGTVTPGHFLLSSQSNGQTNVVATTGGTSLMVSPAQRIRWSDIISSITAGSANDADVVPWQFDVDSTSLAQMTPYIQGHAPVSSKWSPNNQCARTLSRTDSAVVTSGSATVTDAAIATTDKGHRVQPTTGIPANTFVGDVSAGSFKLSSSPTSQVDVPATAPATSVKIESSGLAPLDNDIGPLVNDPVAIQTGTSGDNPENWMWAGSAGVLNANVGLSNVVVGATTWRVHSASINGVKPSANSILQLSYPLAYTIYAVTRKADADCVKTAGLCDFVNHLGPSIASGGNDLNVTGATTGVGGAVREYIRFMCRVDAVQQGIDHEVGTNYDALITGGLNSAGFVIIKLSSQSQGSRCAVVS
jgi:hypothetical protein